MDTFEVLQVCQWKAVKLRDKITSSRLEQWRRLPFRNYEVFSTYLMIKEVGPGNNPPWGRIWYKENEDTGLLEFWKANYDSSD